MIKTLLKKFERTFVLTGVIKEFGVISDFKHKTYQCEVQAFLRKLDDKTVFTLRHKNKHPGNTNIQYLDFDAEGIKGLEETIQKLKEQDA